MIITHSTLFFHQMTEGMARMNHIIAAAKWHRLIVLGLMLILFNLYYRVISALFG